MSSIEQVWYESCTKISMAGFSEECRESTGELSVRNARLSSVPLEPSKRTQLRSAVIYCTGVVNFWAYKEGIYTFLQ